MHVGVPSIGFGSPTNYILDGPLLEEDKLQLELSLLGINIRAHNLHPQTGAVYCSCKVS